MAKRSIYLTPIIPLIISIFLYTGSALTTSINDISNTETELMPSSFYFGASQTDTVSATYELEQTTQNINLSETAWPGVTSEFTSILDTEMSSGVFDTFSTMLSSQDNSKIPSASVSTSYLLSSMIEVPSNVDSSNILMNTDTPFSEIDSTSLTESIELSTDIFVTNTDEISQIVVISELTSSFDQSQDSSLMLSVSAMDSSFSTGLDISSSFGTVEEPSYLMPNSEAWTISPIEVSVSIAEQSSVSVYPSLSQVDSYSIVESTSSSFELEMSSVQTGIDHSSFITEYPPSVSLEASEYQSDIFPSEMTTSYFEQQSSNIVASTDEVMMSESSLLVSPSSFLTNIDTTPSTGTSLDTVQISTATESIGTAIESSEYISETSSFESSMEATISIENSIVKTQSEIASTPIDSVFMTQTEIASIEIEPSVSEPPMSSMFESSSVTTTTTTTIPSTTEPTTQTPSLAYPVETPNRDSISYVFMFELTIERNFSEIEDAQNKEALTVNITSLLTTFVFIDIRADFSISLREGSIIATVESTIEATTLDDAGFTLLEAMENITDNFENNQNDIQASIQDINFNSSLDNLQAVEGQIRQDPCSVISSSVRTCSRSYEYRCIDGVNDICVHRCDIAGNQCGENGVCFYDLILNVTACRCTTDSYRVYHGQNCEDSTATLSFVLALSLGIGCAVLFSCFIIIIVLVKRNRKNCNKSNVNTSSKYRQDWRDSSRSNEAYHNGEYIPTMTGDEIPIYAVSTFKHDSRDYYPNPTYRESTAL